MKFAALIVATLLSVPAFGEDSKEQSAREDLERQLKAMVGSPPTKIRITYLALDEPAMKVTEASFELDGSALPAPKLSTLNSEGEHPIFVGDIAPGEHVLVSKLLVENTASPVVSAEGGYKWPLTLSTRFNALPGIEVAYQVKPARNSGTRDLKQRMTLSAPHSLRMLAKLDDGTIPAPLPRKYEIPAEPVVDPKAEKRRKAAEAKAAKAQAAAEAKEAKLRAAQESKQQAAQEAAERRQQAAQEKAERRQKAAQEKAERQQLAAQEKADREQQASEKKAEREQKAAQEKADREQLAAQEKADREQQAAAKKAEAEQKAAQDKAGGEQRQQEPGSEKNPVLLAQAPTGGENPPRGSNVIADSADDAGLTAASVVDAGAPVVAERAPEPPPVRAPVVEEKGLPIPLLLGGGMALLGLIIVVLARRKRG